MTLKLVDNVTVLQTVTTLDVPCERILTAALDSTLQGVVVMGYDAEGQIYFASSYADGGDVLWLMEKCKTLLLNATVERAL